MDPTPTPTPTTATTTNTSTSTDPPAITTSATSTSTSSATIKTSSSASTPATTATATSTTKSPTSPHLSNTTAGAPSSPTKKPATNAPYAKGRKDRPCDACRRRKSRCVLNASEQKCVLCQFHSQECTFVQSPAPRKRRVGGSMPAAAAATTAGVDSGGSSAAAVAATKKRTAPPIRDAAPVADYAKLTHSSLRTTLGLQATRHSRHLGPTGEFEPALLDLCVFDSAGEHALPTGTIFRRPDVDTTFLLSPDPVTSTTAVDEVESLVAPHGPKLVRLYFKIVHPSYPILARREFLEKYARTHREFAAPLLAAVYLLAIHWWGFDRELAAHPRPDPNALEALAAAGLTEVVAAPKLSGVQAGLLLLQRANNNTASAGSAGVGILASSWALTCTLVALGQELGLHLDCSNWAIPGWEKGLRRRLAWALYMQDKWGALVGGRPSHVSKRDWEVNRVGEGTFEEELEEDMRGEIGELGGGEGQAEKEGEADKGRMLFAEMVKLTVVMAEVLETFFTVEAKAGVAGKGPTQKLLERAKPVQIRLKEWFMKLPDCLRMDAPNKTRKLSSTGYLHLAYFATEITLHRCILRTLTPASAVDPYLLHICRSAAKTRLISAMDFVNRLKPEHLQSFWFFASKLNFALIGTFGSLLWATAPSPTEADFYQARLSEYRWTLRVSSRGAEFMEFAVRTLDAGAGYAQQEMLKKRGWGVKDSAVKGYVDTVGVGDNLTLGMGAGAGVDSSAPLPRNPWESGGRQDSPGSDGGGYGGGVVREDPGEGLSGSEDEDGDEEMGGYDDSRSRSRSNSDAESRSADEDADVDDDIEGRGGETGDGQMDFFMIPNEHVGIGGRRRGSSVVQ